jgi:5'-nucleotidase
MHRTQQRTGHRLLLAGLGVLAGLVAVAPARAMDVRTLAEQPLVWRTRAAHGPTVPVQLLAINDFHGQLSAGEQVSGRPVGSGPVLAGYLREAQETAPGRTFLVHAGDHVGASPPQSTLLQDEPAIQFFNLMGNEHCRTGGAAGPDCNLLGVPGNHELDEGVEELLRLVHGGNHPHGPFLQNPYRGAAFPYLSANLVHAATDEPLFPPAVVRRVDGIKIAFIGAILRQAGQFLPPERLAGLRVLDEAEAINRQVRRLRDEQGVRAFVVIMHQGGWQHAEPPADGTAQLVGDIAGVVDRLDPDVDVVLGGHTHTFHKVLVDNGGGGTTLVAQAWPRGTGFADIDLEIDRKSGEVVALGARIVTTWADRGPGLLPDVRVAALTRQMEHLGAAIAGEAIARSSRPITREVNQAGESALGSLVADSYRQAMAADFAFLHLDGLRADLPPGLLTRGDQFAVQPHNLNLIRLELTGAQVRDLLEQQWQGADDEGRRLQVSGLTYTWDASRPAGQRIVAVRAQGQMLRPEARYTVAVNEHLAGGGEQLSVLTRGVNPVVGPFVAEALAGYLASCPQPIEAGIQGRISRLN